MHVLDPSDRTCTCLKLETFSQLLHVFLSVSMSPPAGRCWWCFLSWRGTPASPLPTAWLTARQSRPPWETGPPPRPPTAPSSPRTLTACTDPGHYDHRPLYPTTHRPQHNELSDHWKNQAQGRRKPCGALNRAERCVIVCPLGCTPLNVKNKGAANFLSS